MRSHAATHYSISKIKTRSPEFFTQILELIRHVAKRRHLFFFLLLESSIGSFSEATYLFVLPLVRCIILVFYSTVLPWEPPWTSKQRKSQFPIILSPLLRQRSPHRIGLCQIIGAKKPDMRPTGILSARLTFVNQLPATKRFHPRIGQSKNMQANFQSTNSWK